MATLRDIAAWVNAASNLPSALTGNLSELVRVSSLADATSDSIVFAIDAKTLNQALDSSAGVILANRDAAGNNESIADVRVLWVSDARYSFAKAAERLKNELRTAGIHPSAVIANSALIAPRTSVGAHVVIGEGVRIGQDCTILPNATIYEGTVLGDRVMVQAGAVLGSTGFGYVRDPSSGSYTLFPQQGTLHIEDDVEIGANTTIDRGALGETRIGHGTKIDNLVHIGHNCRIGRDVIIAAQTGISGSSVVEDGAILGGQVGIGEHATVGIGVILGGGAGVLSGKRMRGAGEVFWGRPARPLKEYLRDLARLRRG